MRFDYQLTQGQPDTAAADLRCLAELKHLRPLFRRDTRSRVCEPQNQLVGVLAGGYLDGAASGWSSPGMAKRFAKNWAKAVAVALVGPRTGSKFFLNRNFLYPASPLARQNLCPQHLKYPPPFASQGTGSEIAANPPPQP